MTSKEDDIEDFPEDEFDYLLKLVVESEKVFTEMVNTTDPDEKIRLSKKYAELQGWIAEIDMGNVWEE